jgi:hypothetical protein
LAASVPSGRAGSTLLSRAPSAQRKIAPNDAPALMAAIETSIEPSCDQFSGKLFARMIQSTAP